jgi:hypothetical protein
VGESAVLENEVAAVMRRAERATMVKLLEEMCWQDKGMECKGHLDTLGISVVSGDDAARNAEGRCGISKRSLMLRSITP